MKGNLSVESITCRYGSSLVLDRFSFAVAPGSIACLLGPSGCGKTTALRAIAGFEPLVSGSITLDDRLISKTGFTLPPEQRHIGMVFQDYALFPHINVENNIRFGIKHLDKTAQREIVDQLTKLVKLEGYLAHYPHQLSGGQQQRVALARALAPAPSILLLDEPFSNLDTQLRRSLSLEVRNILKQRNTSAILVTHDQDEAFSMADETGIMHEGRLQQWGTAEELQNTPVNEFVGDFINRSQALKGKIPG